jgi:acyl-CoA synthetase (AMP-forming)/AMP-acid ligase II
LFLLGVKPEAAEEADTGRGPDTVNRLLLHGARHHERQAVFLSWGKSRKGKRSWQETPDWRADRNSIRVGLVLRERLQVSKGETVAVWAELGTGPAIVERGIWSIGAVSVPVWPGWELEHVAQVLDDAQPQVLFAPERQIVQNLNVIGGLPESVRAVILFEGPADDDEEMLPYEKFMEHGGVLDTAERAAMWRTSAKGAKPEDVISIEYAGDSEEAVRQVVSHSTMVRTMVGISRRFPPAHDRIHLLTDSRPDHFQRALLFAAWADGLTQTAFATTNEAREQVGPLHPNLVACPQTLAGALLDQIRDAPLPAQTGGSVEGAGAERRLSLFVTDGFSAPPQTGGGEAVEFVQPHDLGLEPAVGGARVLDVGGDFGTTAASGGGEGDNGGPGD